MSKSNPSNRYPQWVGAAPEEMFLAGLWRIIRHRHRTITAFALLVVVIVLTASLLEKPRYEAVGQVVFHRDSDSGVAGIQGRGYSLVEDPEDRAAIDTQIGIMETDALPCRSSTISTLTKSEVLRSCGAIRQRGPASGIVP